MPKTPPKKNEKQIKAHCPFCDEELYDLNLPICSACHANIVYCPDCHEPLAQNAVDCPHCGSKVR